MHGILYYKVRRLDTKIYTDRRWYGSVWIHTGPDWHKSTQTKKANREKEKREREIERWREGRRKGKPSKTLLDGLQLAVERRTLRVRRREHETRGDAPISQVSFYKNSEKGKASNGLSANSLPASLFLNFFKKNLKNEASNEFVYFTIHQHF